MDYDVIVIGGGPAGSISAMTARGYYPDKNILVLKNVEKGVIPCGIPYMFSTLKQPEDNAVNAGCAKEHNINLEICDVTKIDPDKHEVTIDDGRVFTYQKLVIATGSGPMVPPIEGIDKKGIYPILKELNHLKRLKEDLEKVKDVIIIGGGFIGIEFADEFSDIEGLNVTVIELLPRVLANSFDPEFSEQATNILSEKGIKLMTGKKAVRFNGDERVESLTLDDGTVVPCQLVVLGMGAVPNTKLAKEAGLEISKRRGIVVDEYLRTSNLDIFAVGDCAEKKDFFTRKKIPVMLASTATAEARIAGSNLFKIKVVRENRGTIATYSTRIGNLTLASAGLTEETALREGFEIIVGHAECPDKHPGAMPDMTKTKVKLIFSKQSELLLGGQVTGGVSAGEIVNVISLALQKSTTLTELETLQMATHPKLTAPPTMSPLVMAAQDALRNR